MLTNAPYLLNLDCDHYFNNSKAIRESMCFMMDPLLGKRVCYVQFPQRFDGIDRHDRYANRNIVFFDVSITFSFNYSTEICSSSVHSLIYNSITDQHERFGWHSRTNICRHRVCVQKAGTLWF